MGAKTRSVLYNTVHVIKYDYNPVTFMQEAQPRQIQGVLVVHLEGATHLLPIIIKYNILTIIKSYFRQAFKLC